MNIALWILQVLLALHTVIGAIWKFSQSPAQTMPSLAAIPTSLWVAMAVAEIIAAVGLVSPALKKGFWFAVPVSAIYIATEMIVFCVVHQIAHSGDQSPMAYWLAVAAVSLFVAIGRLLQKAKP